MRQCHLCRGVTAKTVELVNLAEFFHQRRVRNTIAQLPSRAMINFTKGKTYKASLCKIRVTQHREVWNIIEDEMLVYFVRKYEYVGITNNATKLFNIFFT